MRKSLEDFFQHYLVERNMEATLEHLTEGILTVGTGEHEIGRGKAEFRKLLESEFKELPDPLQYQIVDYSEIDFGETVKNMFAKLDVTLNQGDVDMEMHARLTATCVWEDERWKFASLHLSTPEKEQEENSFFPLLYGRTAVGKMSLESGAKLMELISVALPGGIMGGYLEEGFPLYTINEKMLEILGYTYEELTAISNEKMLNIIYEKDQKYVEDSIADQLKTQNEYEVEYRIVGKNDHVFWVNDIGKKIITEDGREAMISIMTDISERREREKLLQEEAEQDPLTKLSNRKCAFRKIEEEFSRSSGGWLFICDVDNFKCINDTKGHAEGDLVLLTLADIIREQAGELCITARLGGDEYILFFPEAVPTEEAFARIQAIQKEFLVCAKKYAPEVQISLSAGGTQRTDAGENVQTMYVKADEALYQAKLKKGDFRFRK